jgi:hypothetical protein
MIKKLLIFLVGLVLLMVAAIVVVWFNLNWIGNESNLSKVVDRFGFDVQWQDLQIDIQNQGLWGKNLSLSTKDFCFNSKPLIEMCLSRADIRLHLELIASSPFVLLDQVFIDARFAKFKVEVPPGSEKEPVLPFSFPKWTIGSLQDLLASYFKQAPLAAIEKISIELPAGEVLVSPAMKILADLRMVSTEAALELKGTVSVEKAAEEFITLQLQSDLKLTMPLELSGNLNLALAKNPMTVALDFHWKDFPEFELTSQVPLSSGTIKYQATAQLQKQSWSIAHSAQMRGAHLPFQEIQLEECRTELTFTGGLPSHLKWPCQIALNRLKKAPLKGLPNSLHIPVVLNAPIKLRGSGLYLSPQLHGVLLESVLADLKLDVSAEVAVDVEKKELQQLDLRQLELLLKIPAIENIAKILARSLWALPAPVGVLKGPLQLQVTSQTGNILANELQISAQLNTDLNSQRQVLKTQTMAQMTIDLKKPLVILQGDLSLQDVRLELPYIGLEAPPQFKPDPRFIKGKSVKVTQEPTRPSVFELKDFTIHTNDRPVLLFTRLLPNPIPVNIKYQIQSPMALSGEVSLGKMDFEVFRKKAVLEKFNVTKFKDSSVQDLDGLITHRTSEVKIEILVVGTTEKPRIEFLSDPPLSRQQIISILLFNKSLQQLADDEKSTAGQLDQALLSEAFGLASLFLLSSTPIESVYFDPTTQSYVARVKIDDSTSVSLGSDFDASQQVTLRRRLGGPWSISTALQQSKNSEDIVTTLIEWFRRF